MGHPQTLQNQTRANFLLLFFGGSGEGEGEGRVVEGGEGFDGDGVGGEEGVDEAHVEFLALDGHFASKDELIFLPGAAASEAAGCVGDEGVAGVVGLLVIPSENFVSGSAGHGAGGFGEVGEDGLAAGTDHRGVVAFADAAVWSHARFLEFLLVVPGADEEGHSLHAWREVFDRGRGWRLQARALGYVGMGSAFGGRGTGSGGPGGRGPFGGHGEHGREGRVAGGETFFHGESVAGAGGGSVVEVNFGALEVEFAVEDERIALPVAGSDEGLSELIAEGVALESGGFGVPSDDLLAADVAFGATGRPIIGDVGKITGAGVCSVEAVGFAGGEERGFFVVLGDVEGAEEDL